MFASTLLTLFVTLGDRGGYNLSDPDLVQSVGTWLWLVVYVVVPPIMAIVLVQQLRRGGRDPVRSQPIPSGCAAYWWQGELRSWPAV